MAKPEAEALKAQIDYYAQLTEDRINAGEILIVENDTPNVSLKVFYNETKNCTEVRLNAWHPLKEDEVKAIKKFIAKRKENARKPYPVGGIINGTADHAADAAYMAWEKWIEEGGPIDRETFMPALDH